MFLPFKKLILNLKQVSTPEALLNILNQLQSNLDSVFYSINKIQNDSVILNNISLSIGSNIIEHKLNRKLLGYNIIRKRSQASIYDEQDTNQSPELTLVLNSDQDVVIDLEIF